MSHPPPDDDLCQAMLDTILLGDIQGLHALLREHGTPAAQLLLPGGEPLLHQAIDAGHLDAVAALLNYRADPNQPDPHGQFPLHRAVSEAGSATVRLLLEHGARVDETDALRHTALQIAAERADRASVEILLAHGADPNAKLVWGTALHLASGAGDPTLVRRLIDAGAEVDGRTTGGHTPLHVAARNGHLSATRALLAAGAAVDARTEQGRTPWALARGLEHDEIARLLEAAQRHRALDAPTAQRPEPNPDGSPTL